MGRSARVAGAALALLLAALALLLALTWWWAGTEGSLARALAWWAEPTLKVKQVTGSLRRGGRIGALRWQDAQGRDISASDITLRWNLRALLNKQVHLQQVQMGSLQLRWPPSAEPSAGPPDSLELPLQVQVDTLHIDRLLWTGPPAFEASALRARYNFNGERHALTLSQASVAQGVYSGQAELQAHGPMTLNAQLQGELNTAVPGSRRSLPLQVQLTATGPLTDLQLQGAVSGQPGHTGPAAKAELSARVMPWVAQPLAQAKAAVDRLNLAWLWPQAPQTQLTGQAQVQPGANGSWLLNGQFNNTLSGPWDMQRLPLNQTAVTGQWQSGRWLLQSLNAQVGAGRVQAQGQWTSPDRSQPSNAAPGWDVLTRFEQLNTANLHSQWPAQTLQGQARWQGLPDGLGFDLQVQPGVSALNPLQLVDAQAKGTWRSAAGGSLDLQGLKVRTRQAELTASGQYQVQAQAAEGELNLQAPGLRITGGGELRPERGAGQARLQGQDLAAAWRWLRTMPGLAAYLPPAPTPGRADLQLNWQGGWRQPTLQVSLDIPTLDWSRGASAPSADPLQLRDVQVRLDGPLSRAQVSASGQVAQGQRRVQLATAGEGGVNWAGPPGMAWQASLRQLSLSLQDPHLGQGHWQLAAQRPVVLKGTAQSVELQPGQAQLSAPARPGAANTPAVLDWQAARWQPGLLRTAGTLQGLPQAWAELLAGGQGARAGVAGDLLFDARWDLNLTERLRLDAELTRRSGDLSIHAETSGGLATRVAAGVREARLTLQSEADQVRATLRWDSERAGQLNGFLQTRLNLSSTQGLPTWSQDAPLSGELQAQLPRIGAWSLLAPPGWRLRGSLGTALRVSGTRAQPQLSGQVQADDLALRSVVDGVELGDGRLRARLDGTRLLIDEFMLQGAGPRGSGGQVTATGEAGWLNGQPQVQLKAELKQLRASVRTDRQLTVSGDLQAALRGHEGEITGVLRVDQARLELPSEDRPQLDGDVVVRGLASTELPNVPSGSPPAGGQAKKLKVSVAVRLDLGDDFRLQGKGVTTRLRGAVAVSGDGVNTPRLFGTVNTAEGEYRAYGQRLNIERGVLRFTGALDNPALDILAVRPNLTQRVGIQISGTALLPRVRLYADPELPEAEKLSWLVLGRSSAAGGSEAALLQQAAIALLGGGKGGGDRNLAATLGLDELSFRTPSSQADGTTSAGAVMLGKRFSRNFYAAYERTLSGTMGTLYMFYELSRRFTVRAQAGEQTAIDLIFTVPYE